MLNYLEKGKGRPLLLLHGNGESCESFAPQIEFFSELFHVYAIDTRGHGHSERGTEPFTIKQFSEDLYGFVNKMQIEDAYVIGFSDGGNIVLQFLTDHPGIFSRAVVSGANIFPSGMKYEFFVSVILSWFGYAVSSLIDKKNVRNRELMALMAFHPHISRKSLGKIRIPVLLTAGTDDVIRKEHTELIHKCISGSELRFIDGGHSVIFDAPDTYNAAIFPFFSKQ